MLNSRWTGCGELLGLSDSEDTVGATVCSSTYTFLWIWCCYWTDCNFIWLFFFLQLWAIWGRGLEGFLKTLHFRKIGLIWVGGQLFRITGCHNSIHYLFSWIAIVLMPSFHHFKLQMADLFSLCKFPVCRIIDIGCLYMLYFVLKCARYQEKCIFFLFGLNCLWMASDYKLFSKKPRTKGTHWLLNWSLIAFSQFVGKVKYV